MVNRIVVAVDDSAEAEAALRVAAEIGARVGAKVTALRVLTTIPVLAGAGSATLKHWVENASRESATPVKSKIAYGYPAIEICRFAEDAEADLIVLGRKKHCTRSRLLLGDTADAVARRSQFPTLFVPTGGVLPRRILVALDRSLRGMRVLEKACDLVRALEAELQVVTVERTPVRQFFGEELPHANGASLQQSVSDILTRKGLPDCKVTSRRGHIAEEVLAQLAECGCDALALGHHRGEPSWAVQAGSTAQKLSHAAPCAVLTIPL